MILSDFISNASLVGDFDNNRVLDAVDIDQLSAAVGGSDSSFDLTADGVIDQADRDFWVEALKETYFGDANLDGEFNSSDFVQVFQRGEYEDAIVGNSGWADGDWNGDSEFDTSDVVLAFQAGGYEAGPRVNVAAVPEPTAQALASILLVVVSLARSHCYSKCRTIGHCLPLE